MALIHWGTDLRTILRADLERGGIIFCKVVGDVKFLMKWRNIMLGKILKSTVVFGLGCMFLIAPPMVNACDFHDTLVQCDQTALNNYNSGEYTLEVYYDFTNTYCPAAAASCLEEN